MKSPKTVVSFLSILTIVLCSQAAAAQESKGGNAIPYPLKEWKGVQGKLWPNRNPISSGNPKRPMMLPMC